MEYFMMKKIFAYMVILVINFILWTACAYSSQNKQDFILDTQKYVQHKPIIADAVKIAKSISSINDNDIMPTKISQLGRYCIQKKRRGFYLQNDNDGQNYVAVRGGIVLNYTNCNDGNNAQIKIKRHNIYGFYQIKF
jgi:hypothetical protein